MIPVTEQWTEDDLLTYAETELLPNAAGIQYDGGYQEQTLAAYQAIAAKRAFMAKKISERVLLNALDTAVKVVLGDMPYHRWPSEALLCRVIAHCYPAPTCYEKAEKWFAAESDRSNP